MTFKLVFIIIVFLIVFVESADDVSIMVNSRTFQFYYLYIILHILKLYQDIITFSGFWCNSLEGRGFRHNIL